MPVEATQASPISFAYQIVQEESPQSEVLIRVLDEQRKFGPLRALRVKATYTDDRRVSFATLSKRKGDRCTWSTAASRSASVASHL